MPDDTAMFCQWGLLKSLSSSRTGLSVRDMAAEAAVNDETIRRDLDVFRRLGVPLVEDIGPFGRKTWRITSPAGQPPLGFFFGRIPRDPICVVVENDDIRPLPEIF